MDRDSDFGVSYILLDEKSELVHKILYLLKKY